MPLEDIRQARLKKLGKIEEMAGNAFPSESIKDFSLSDVVADFSKISRKRRPINLVGRVFGVRGHGGIVFCDFKDGSSDKKNGDLSVLQAYIKKDIVGDEQFSFFEESVDVGDFIEFNGSLFKTKKGERSIKVTSFRFLSKGLMPLPEKWHGLSDVEERFRKRYLDLLMNDEVRTVFVNRSKLVAEIRNFLNKKDFLEVETPILQPIASGALAEPFRTRHNALGIDLFLRIAPELYLKRLLVAGFEKVYEIGRNFRNEGIDMTHNPEFTMLEFYQAYKDSEYARDLVEDLFKTLAKKVSGKKLIEYDGKEISFSKKFDVVSFYDVIKRHALINNPEETLREDFALKAQQFGIEVSDADTKEKIADNIFKKLCRSKIIQPTFVVDYPVELFHLAKKKKDNLKLADCFQLYIGGLELVKGYSEINSPIEQKNRFEEQQKLRKAGDKEAPEFDKDFIEALEYGMPPAAGVGIGIERLAMFFTDTQNIKEVILFPTMRPKE
ncbi:MAG: lysine--tRNA ligase [Patescibacteria group bacterium]